MAGSEPRRGSSPRTRRSLTPNLEPLDPREMMDAGAGHSLGEFLPPLGTFVAPDQVPFRVSRPGLPVDPHQAINRELAAVLGPGMGRILRQVEFSQASERSSISERVLSLPFIQAVLSKKDTFNLLGSPAIRGIDLSDDLGPAYFSTSSILQDALRTTKPVEAPRAAENVPGLRLYNNILSNRNLTHGGHNSYTRYLRIASDRRLFNLTPSQQSRVNDRFQQFLNTVQALNTAGAFNAPDTPPAGLVEGPLNGTLAVTTGAFRQIFVDDLDTGVPVRTGLNIRSDINFPGRVDVGFIFDRRGNYGIILTARGPLESTVPGQAQANIVGGDVQVEVSNASTITGVNGLRSVEAINLGSALSGSITASQANGVSTFAGSAGYGAGLEYGVGNRYIEVIPLGNVLSFPTGRT